MRRRRRIDRSTSLLYRRNANGKLTAATAAAMDQSVRFC